MIRIISPKTPSILSMHFPEEMPKYLIYTKRDVNLVDLSSMKSFKADIFRMADTETGEYAGEMITRTMRDLKLHEIYPKQKKVDALKIERLIVENKRHGYGSAFLRFAQAESERQGCGGKVFLLASRIYDPKHPCHIFYKKQGYTSTNNFINRILDKCIKTHTKLDPEYADNLLMFRPVDETKQPQHQESRLLKFLKKLFNIVT